MRLPLQKVQNINDNDLIQLVGVKMKKTIFHPEGDRDWELATQEQKGGMAKISKYMEVYMKSHIFLGYKI